MPAYTSTEHAEAVFGELFRILLRDDNFRTRLRDTGLSVRILQTKPDCVVYLSADEVRLGEDAPDTASITIKMSCDTAHALWLGTLMMPTAIATGKIRIRGKVAKVIEFVPILQPAFDLYPQIAADSGVAA
jgi:putative sterol carrier protein